MENTETTWLGGIRQRYNLLLFLATSSIPLVLWGLIILINFLGGTLFRDPNQLGMDLFMVFIFPLIAAPIIGGAALVIAKLLSIRGVRWLVVVGLGVVIPLVAFVMVWVGHLIARKLYTGHKAESSDSSGLVFVGTPADKKMEQLKDMLDQGLITRQDYELKKADILARM
jgi:hypothetical protein